MPIWFLPNHPLLNFLICLIWFNYTRILIFSYMSYMVQKNYLKFTYQIFLHGNTGKTYDYL